MAAPILAFLATMGARYGASKAIKMAITKFGKKAFQKATEKMSFVGKNIYKKIKSKTHKDTKAHKETLKIREKLGLNKVTKSKPVKHKTELQRVKAQIAKDLKTPKVKPITGKVVGKVRRNYGKWKPTYARPVKPKPRRFDLKEKKPSPGWISKNDYWHWNGKKWIVKSGLKSKVKQIWKPIYRKPKKP